MKNVTKLDSDKQVDKSVGRGAHATWDHYTQYFREDYAVYRAADSSALAIHQCRRSEPFQRALEAFREIQHGARGPARRKEYSSCTSFQEDDRLPDFAAEFVGSSFVPCY